MIDQIVIRQFCGGVLRVEINEVENVELVFTEKGETLARIPLETERLDDLIEAIQLIRKGAK